MEDQLWLNKYKPSTLQDFIGLYPEIASIKKWLTQFKTGTFHPSLEYNGLLITGPSGIGKTTLVYNVCEACDITLLEFNSSNKESITEIKTRITNMLSFRNIMAIFNNTTTISGILIDDLDSIESRRELGSVQVREFLLHEHTRYYSKHKTKKKARHFIPNKNPIICIANKDSLKSLNKLVMHIKIYKPSDDNIYTLLRKIISNENLDLSQTSTHRIVPYCQNDYRRAISIIFDIKQFLDVNPNNKALLHQKIAALSYKDMDGSVYTLANNILSHKQTIAECYNAYQLHGKNLIRLIIDNFIHYIDKNCKGTYEKKVKIALKLYEDYIRVDVFNNNLFGNWAFSDYIVMLALYCTNFIFMENLRPSIKTTYLTNSSLVSKYNYKYYNLKYINRLAKLLDIDISNFKIISSLFYDVLFNNIQFLELYVNKARSHSLDHKDFIKIIKLNTQTTTTITKKKRKSD